MVEPVLAVVGVVVEVVAVVAVVAAVPLLRMLQTLMGAMMVTTRGMVPTNGTTFASGWQPGVSCT
jgi:hypothetical protein